MIKWLLRTYYTVFIGLALRSRANLEVYLGVGGNPNRVYRGRALLNIVPIWGESLLMSGANPNIVDISLLTPLENLFTAQLRNPFYVGITEEIRSVRYRLAKQLLEYGADPSLAKEPLVDRGDDKMIELLMAYNAPSSVKALNIACIRRSHVAILLADRLDVASIENIEPSDFIDMYIKPIVVKKLINQNMMLGTKARVHKI